MRYVSFSTCYSLFISLVEGIQCITSLPLKKKSFAVLMATSTAFYFLLLQAVVPRLLLNVPLHMYKDFCGSRVWKLACVMSTSVNLLKHMTNTTLLLLHMSCVLVIGNSGRQNSCLGQRCMNIHPHSLMVEGLLSVRCQIASQPRSQEYLWTGRYDHMESDNGPNNCRHVKV